MKVFLSYPSEQAKPAEEIYGFLQEHGVDVWFDKKSIFGGQDWKREIWIAQQNAQLFVLICSKEIVSKAGTIQVEIKAIIDRIEQQPLGHIFLICLRTERIQLPEELVKWQYIDYFSDNWKIKLAESMILRYAQLDVNPPTKLTDYINPKDYMGIAAKSINKTIDKMTLLASFFLYEKKESYWDYVDSEIIQSVYADYHKNIRDYEGSLMPEEPAAWEFNVQESFRVEQIVSLRMAYYNYMRGPALSKYWCLN